MVDKWSTTPKLIKVRKDLALVQLPNHLPLLLVKLGYPVGVVHVAKAAIAPVPATSCPHGL